MTLKRALFAFIVKLKGVDSKNFLELGPQTPFSTSQRMRAVGSALPIIHRGCILKRSTLYFLMTSKLTSTQSRTLGHHNAKGGAKQDPPSEGEKPFFGDLWNL